MGLFVENCPYELGTGWLGNFPFSLSVTWLAIWSIGLSNLTMAYVFKLVEFLSSTMDRAFTLLWAFISCNNCVILSREADCCGMAGWKLDWELDWGTCDCMG